jgi:uncharacterized protein (TIGR03083 family)
MTQTPSFPELLSLIEDRSAALRVAVTGFPDLDARVPGCPDWSLRDLVEHVGAVQRFWAAAVTAGPGDKPPSRDAVGDIAPRGDLLSWSADSTGLLLEALRAAGPDQGCWAWWGASEAPLTVGAVARHQVQEAAVHAYDAQETVGHPEPIPAAVALDGVPEFLTVSHGSSGPWPHRPARLGLHAVEGPLWLLDLTPAGAAIVRGDEGSAAAVMYGSAGDLVLALYGRIPLEHIRIEGDRALVEDVLAWPCLD